MAREGADGVVELALADLLASVKQWTSPSGDTAAYYESDTYGSVLSRQPVGGRRFAHSARPWDATADRYDYRGRAYDPAVGRFLSQDPLGTGPDHNPYRYVGNSPTSRTDPLGLCHASVRGSDGGWASGGKSAGGGAFGLAPAAVGEMPSVDGGDLFMVGDQETQQAIGRLPEPLSGPQDAPGSPISGYGETLAFLGIGRLLACWRCRRILNVVKGPSVRDLWLECYRRHPEDYGKVVDCFQRRKKATERQLELIKRTAPNCVKCFQVKPRPTRL